MVAGSPEGRQGGTEHEVPVARGMDDVLVWSCQLHTKRGAAAPATGAAAAAEVSAWLDAARIALYEAAVAQSVVQHDGVGLLQLAQLLAHHPAGELAVLDILLGKGIFTGNHLPQLPSMASLVPRPPATHF